VSRGRPGACDPRHRVGARVATVLLFWPAAPFIRGKEVTLKKGTMMTAFSDADIVLPTPPAS
jgi:hypothetical protein